MVNYLSVINVGVAMLLIIILGFVCVKVKIVKPKNIPKINKFVFKITLIPQMCRAFALKDLYSMSFKPLLGCILMSITTQILLLIIVQFIPTTDKFKTFLGIQLPVVYLNYVIIGVPLFNSIWGEENNAITSVIILSNDLFIIPIYQVLVSIYKIRKARESATEGEEANFSCSDVLKIIGNVFKSPLIQGIIIGIIWSLSTLPFPQYLQTLTVSLSGCVVGVSLFCVGGFLSQYSLMACSWTEFLVGMFLRFFIMPLLSCCYSYAIGLNNTQIRQCLIMVLVTSSVACYTISSAAEINPGVSTSMILWSTALFVPIMIAWLASLDALGLFIEE